MEKFVEPRFTEMVKNYFNVFYSYCPDDWFCDGWIDCPFLTPYDEANCTGCPTGEIQCDCNQKGNFTCEINSTTRRKRTCYPRSCKC